MEGRTGGGGSGSRFRVGRPARRTAHGGAATTAVGCGRTDRTQFAVLSFVVATFSSVTRQHLLQALAEYDARGGEQFREVYGFGPSQGYTLVHEGRSYDVKAILGVAHRFATGRLAPPDEFNSDIQSAVAIVRKRGFEVSEPASAARATPPRAPRTTRTPVARATAARETPPAICPTCSMTLPATGICDECG
jgi:hypothetical protein